MKKQHKIIFLTLVLLTLRFLTSYSQTTDSLQFWSNSLTFSQKLNWISKQKTNGMIIKFSNIDSTNGIVDIKLNFHFSNKAIDVFQHDIYDTSIVKSDLTRKKDKDIYNTTLFFKAVKLNWNIETNSFMNIDTLIILEINNNLIDKKITGKLEITPQITDSKFNLIVKTNYDNSYYFEYSNHFLGAISTNPIFNNIIITTRPNKKIIKEKKGLAAYHFFISSERKLKNFLYRIDYNSDNY